MNIESITARQILDSRGNPTVEADVWCRGNILGRAAVPSGASTGAHEAHELRDGGTAFNGKGVTQVVKNIQTEISDALHGIPADDQFKIDEILISLDGTDTKERLGANALLAVSLAVSHAAAAVRKVPLFQHFNDIAGNPEMSIPLPMCNVLNGGAHATNASDFQEFMIIPNGASSYAEAMQRVIEVFQSLKKVLHNKQLSTTVGDEGGFAPSVSSNTETLELLMEAVTKAGYAPGEDISFALDVAASEFYKNEHYTLATENRSLSATQMIQYLADMSKAYPIVSIEDGLTEDAWDDWETMTKQLSSLQIVGDDFLVTNENRLKMAIGRNAANAILIKPNQIGTLTETLHTIKTAKDAGWNTVVSHRSGETEDVTIAHLAVGTGAGQIKTGSVSRGERTAKHNELLRIEELRPDLKLAS